MDKPGFAEVVQHLLSLWRVEDAKVRQEGADHLISLTADKLCFPPRRFLATNSAYFHFNSRNGVSKPHILSSSKCT
jgi:hypothetical protein